jgi:hypothetical protein
LGAQGGFEEDVWRFEFDFFCMNAKRLLMILSIAFPVLTQGQVPKASANADYLGLSRELLNKYYDTRKVLDKERSEWKLGKDVLQSRVDLLDSQLKDLAGKTEEEGKTISTNDTEREKLDARNKELLAVQDQQFDIVDKMEARVRKLWKMLPGTLQAKLQPQYDGMPVEGKKRDEIKATAAERFLKVLAILNEVNKFHSDITVVNERRKLDDGREVEVRTIYFGLGVAYYAGSEETAEVAGIGTPGADGWVWKALPSEAKRIDLLIGMNKGEKVADFVSLPVDIK